MTISEALQLQDKGPHLVAFVGAGGKTTCIFRLAEELKRRKMKVLVTTTTKIYYPEARLYDRILIQPDAEVVCRHAASAAPGSITVAAKEFQQESGKLKGFSPGEIDLLSRSGLINYILVEADGSKCKPVKAPALYEPVLAARTDILVGMTGFDCYGKSIDTETVHRIREFCKITGTSEGENIDKETLLSLVTSETGLFKAAPDEARRIWILSQVDDRERLTVAESVGRYIATQDSRLATVIIAALKQKNPVKRVFRR